MRSLVRAAFVVAALTSVPAAGEPAKVEWQGLAIAYEPEVWRAEPPQGGATLVLTCIAPDCRREPKVYAAASQAPPPGAAVSSPFCSDHVGYRDARVLPLGTPTAGGIEFSATSRWSGCRARDAPILEACGEHGGTLYRLSTLIGEGCNFAPELPVDRFTALLRGIRPVASPPN